MLLMNLRASALYMLNIRYAPKVVHSAGYQAVTDVNVTHTHTDRFTKHCSDEPRLNMCAAVTEMGDRLAIIDTDRKEGGCAPLGGGFHLTQCCLG